jgi:hypothetical protein
MRRALKECFSSGELKFLGVDGILEVRLHGTRKLTFDPLDNVHFEGGTRVHEMQHRTPQRQT